MLSLATSASRAQALLDAVADPNVAVAVTNHPDQTVVSGRQDAMDRVAAAARELRMGGHQLNSPYPFHSPLLADAAQAFHNSIKHIGTASLKTTVYSPILGRAYEPADDLMAELASHLTRPVRFSDAMVAVADSGIRTYVECGAMPTLVKLTDRALAARAADARFVAPLPGSGDEWAAWNDALARLRGTKLTVAQPSGLARALVPERTARARRSTRQVPPGRSSQSCGRASVTQASACRPGWWRTRPARQQVTSPSSSRCGRRLPDRTRC